MGILSGVKVEMERVRVGGCARDNLTSFPLENCAVILEYFSEKSYSRYQIQRSAVIVTLARMAIGYSDSSLLPKKDLLVLKIF